MAIGVRDMARRLGCAPSLVSRYKGAGMPMDSEASARAWLAANVRPDPRTAFAPPPSAPSSPLETPADDYQSARTRREAAEADLAELKLAEQQGQLVRAADVRAALAKKAAALRESMLQIPARLAPVLAAEADAARVHDHLQTELHAVLAQFVET